MNFWELVNKLKKIKGGIYLLGGNGTKNQFRYLNDLKKIIKQISLDIPKESSFLYFGDTPNKDKPDIGYAFQILKKQRPDIKIYMIQIDIAKSWGYPDFVEDVYWHNDFNKKCKWGGINNGKPCSNTKKWVSINNYIKINKAFILGGGQITLDEIKLFNKYNIDYKYYLIERRYLGDGKTKIHNNDSIKAKIGITYHLIKS